MTRRATAPDVREAFARARQAQAADLYAPMTDGRVTCPTCNGTGAAAGRPLSRCEGCDGAGRVLRERICDCEGCGSDALASVGRCEWCRQARAERSAA